VTVTRSSKFSGFAEGYGRRVSLSHSYPFSSIYMGTLPMNSSRALKYIVSSRRNPMINRKISFGSIVLLACLAMTSVASAQTGSFTVHFAGCTEFAGWGPVSLAEAQPLVPAGYVIAGAAMGQASIVVRATNCESVAVGLSAAQPTVISQIGINLVAPDETGNINNYTVIYVTNNLVLAEYFRTVGLPAVFDPELTYEYTPGPMGTSGELYVAASGQGLPPYFLFGTETDPPPNSQQSFLANWWFTGYGGKIKQSTSFPVISFGTAAVTLYTSRNSLLGDLIGGNTDSNFPILSVRGVYPAATMTVTISRAGGG
jgi:hypothetical protein